MAFLFFYESSREIMSTTQTEQPRPTRATVVPMPPRTVATGRPATTATPPPRHEPESCDEPGYGHGV
jgi:hypothetical protein